MKNPETWLASWTYSVLSSKPVHTMKLTVFAKHQLTCFNLEMWSTNKIVRD